MAALIMTRLKVPLTSHVTVRHCDSTYEIAQQEWLVRRVLKTNLHPRACMACLASWSATHGLDVIKVTYPAEPAEPLAAVAIPALTCCWLLALTVLSRMTSFSLPW